MKAINMRIHYIMKTAFEMLKGVKRKRKIKKIKIKRKKKENVNYLELR